MLILMACNDTGKLAGRDNCICLKFHFIILNMALPNLAQLACGCSIEQNRQLALTHYINALRLGGTKTLPELYEAAGLKFDLSPDYIKTLMEFVNREFEEIG